MILKAHELRQNHYCYHYRPRLSAPAIISTISTIIITIISISACLWTSCAARGLAWQLERDGSLVSPAHQHGRVSQIFNGRPFQYQHQSSGHHAGELFLDNQQLLRDMFMCVDPSPSLFERFAIQYNRSFERGGSSLSERQRLFDTTLRRTITLNRIIQNEVLNVSNYQAKPKIGNYHFISPMGVDNFALWFADVTECELGLIKKALFDIFDLIDRNELDIAYQIAHEKRHHLPLFSEVGFEQLANILLVRLYDRFEGDKKMFQLFQWPLYMKKLASYAYNRQQVAQPNFISKLTFIRYAYPSYFKDLKYNQQAINRTGDNWKAHWEHKKFNKLLARKFSNIQEQNKRLAIFRQRWTEIQLLNEDDEAKKWIGNNNTSDSNTVAGLEPDWLSAAGHQYQPDLYPASAKLQSDDSTTMDAQFSPTPIEWRFKPTSFSDLNDAEFVAYLTNDFSLLEKNPESANFLEANFPVRPLSREFRDELAAELELRRLVQLPSRQQQQQDPGVMQKRPTYSLARQVIDELIGDVGLPVGPTSLDNIAEQEHYRVFNELKSYFNKNYQPQSLTQDSKLTETDLIDEQQRRYERFKENYGRFKAWFIKENWKIEDIRPMLRLADMSWPDIKLTLFKVCCLTRHNLEELSSTNSSIRYLGSNDFLCQPLAADSNHNNHNNNDNNRQQTSSGRSVRAMAALELYYYYSVHFNKHHDDSMAAFRRRFATFRHNIDQIRWHSCTRGLTLYNSLRMKNFDALNSIDVLDPRRSHMDDINLDRFLYFSIPDLSSSAATAPTTAPDDLELGFASDRLTEGPSRPDYALASASASRPAESSRAAISYRREPVFAKVLEQTQRQPKYPRHQSESYYSYADRLTVASQDYNISAQKYRSLAAQRVYDLVNVGYSDCMRTTRGIDIEPADLEPRQCLSAGSLADRASDGQLMLIGSSSSSSSSQQDAAYSRNQRLQLDKDSCSLYWQGLQSWSEGLIKQDTMSAVIIQSARCERDNIAALN